MTDINYSFSLGGDAPAPPPPPPPKPVDDRLWSFTGVELLPLGELTLLLDQVGGGRMPVQPELAITLTHCEPFRTLRGHADYLVTVLPELGGQVEPIIPVLEQIRDAGFFRSAEDIIEKLTGPTSAPNQAAAQSPLNVCVITCDRPEAVERLLGSMEGARSLDIASQYWLIDDSRDAGNQARNKALAEECNARGSLPIRYFGLGERQALIDHLVQDLPEAADSIRFLLDRAEWGSLPTYGLSRSIALLLSAGRRLVILDDDILCEAVRCPLPSPGLSFGSARGREAVFYPTREALLTDTRRLPDSPIALAARQLGMNLAGGLKSLVHGDVTPHTLAGANGAFIRALSADSPIIKTQCSTWGDPGTSNGHWIVDLHPESIGRLLDTPGGMAATVDARSVWLGYTGPTLAKHGVMSQLTGYDASRLLPPFIPAFRGEDALFAYMLNAMYPESLVLNHDWAVPHLPLEERGQRNLKAAIAGGGGLSLLTRWLSENEDNADGIKPETRLGRMAHSLSELAELDEQALMNFGRLELAKQHAGQWERYRTQLQQAGQLGSDNWVQYLQRGNQELSQALQQEPSLATLLGTSTADNPEILASVRAGGKRFSTALRHWPVIWESAKGFNPA